MYFETDQLICLQKELSADLSVQWVPGTPPPGPSGDDSSIYYRGLECVDVHLLFDIRLYDVYNEVTRR